MILPEKIWIYAKQFPTTGKSRLTRFIKYLLEPRNSIKGAKIYSTPWLRVLSPQALDVITFWDIQTVNFSKIYIREKQPQLLILLQTILIILRETLH